MTSHILTWSTLKSESEPAAVIRLEAEHHKICRKHGAPFLAAPESLKAGIAQNIEAPLWPINGLRHQPEEGTTGWFLWAGEQMEESDDFFKPAHVHHLKDLRPEVLPYLGLAPGWRFLIAPNYEDVWYDPSLLDD
ncbi:MAG: immunity protein Imm33 domain-containing protein [Caulobacteraceae bacterium]